MKNTILRFGLGVLLIACLAACGGRELIKLNDQFDMLTEKAVDVEQRLREGELDQTEYNALIGENWQSFAENGDRAVNASGEDDSPQGKASFLYLAVRSYLGSGPIADTKIPDLVRQGIELCNTTEMQGLNALPTTCATFYFATAQAISNEAQRTVAELSRQSQLNASSDGAPTLTAEDGLALRAAFGLFIAQIEEIDRAVDSVDQTNVDPAFLSALGERKVVFFCNAVKTRAHFDDVVETGAGWNLEATLEESLEEVRQAQAALDIGSPSNTCFP